MATSSKAVAVTQAATPRESFFRYLLEDLRDNKTAYLLLLPSIASFLALVIYPLATTIQGAFSLTDAVGRITQFGTLKNFLDLTQDSYMSGIVRQTFLYAFGTVALTVLFSFPLALILNQKFFGAPVARGILLLPWAAPLAVSAMTWRWIFHDQLGALNYLLHLTGITQQSIIWLGDGNLAFGAVMFVEVWSSIPFMTITFLAGLQSLPPHIFDAAKMDGAGPWNELWDMTIPQMKKIFMIVTLLSVIWAFRSFTIIWTMTQGNPFYRTDISVTYLYKLAFKNLDFGQGFALAFATFVLLCIFSIIYARTLQGEEL